MNTNTKRLTVSALLVALGVILSRFLSIPVSLFGTYSFNIGFGMLPILLLAVLYGPLYGCIGAAAWDLLGAILFPKGAFVIWFTFAAAALGLVTGLFFASPSSDKYLKRPATFKRTILAIACGQIVYSVILNTMLIAILYHVPVKALLIPRLIENAIMIPVNTILVIALLKALSGAYIINDKLPADIKAMQKKPETVIYSTNDLLGMVGGYICNNDYDKAQKAFEEVMLAYKKDPTSFTPSMKKEVVGYKKELEAAKKDTIVVGDTFDIDEELGTLGDLIRQGDREKAKSHAAKLSDYYIKNPSMFSEGQKEKLRILKVSLM